MRRDQPQPQLTLAMDWYDVGIFGGPAAETQGWSTMRRDRPPPELALAMEYHHDSTFGEPAAESQSWGHNITSAPHSSYATWNRHNRIQRPHPSRKRDLHRTRRTLARKNDARWRCGGHPR